MSTKASASMSVDDTGNVIVSGVLNFDSVASMADKLINIIRDNNKVHIDFSGTTDANSAALSLLIELRRSASQTSCQLSMSQIPAHLNDISEAYGVDMANVLEAVV